LLAYFLMFFVVDSYYFVVDSYYLPHYTYYLILSQVVTVHMALLCQ